MDRIAEGSSVRVTVVQSAPRIEDVDANLAACIAHLERAAQAGSDLVVFPECALSGYMLSDEQAARRCADAVPGRITDTLGETCARTGLHCVVGMLESEGAALYNSAVLMGPRGIVGRYRKSHIACIGADCFTVPGDDPYQVLDTPVGRIGLQICYDWRFPEITRVLALQGAEIIVHPTNSPAQARELAEFITRARAAENAVYFVTANRCGSEGGTTFFGWSQIVDPQGRRIAQAGSGETVLTADLDLRHAREKTKEPQQGGYHVRLFEDRRPDLYSVLAKNGRLDHRPPTMKRLGLLGGMSWESSAVYYRFINEAVRDRLGGMHSADLVMRSIDFADIEALQRDGKWLLAGERLASEARLLANAGAELLVLCTNTLHKVADAIGSRVDVPLLHIADCSADAVNDADLHTVGLLGSIYAMEQGFYVDRLRERHGLNVLVPDGDGRRMVNDIIYRELCQGVFREQSRDVYRHVIHDLVERGAEGILLGCTEIGLLLSGHDADVPMFDTARLHAERAVDMALGLEVGAARS